MPSVVSRRSCAASSQRDQRLLHPLVDLPEARRPGERLPGGSVGVAIGRDHERSSQSSGTSVNGLLMYIPADSPPARSLDVLRRGG